MEEANLGEIKKEKDETKAWSENKTKQKELNTHKEQEMHL